MQKARLAIETYITSDGSITPDISRSQFTSPLPPFIIITTVDRLRRRDSLPQSPAQKRPPLPDQLADIA